MNDKNKKRSAQTATAENLNENPRQNIVSGTDSIGQW